MRTAVAAVLAQLALLLTAGPAAAQGDTFTWRYYRVGNTGTQGDYNPALYVAPDGTPYVGGYDPFFEEGGFARFDLAQDRWFNVSNVDWPVIGNPAELGCSRVEEIVAHPDGLLWMGTWTGALTYDPVAGPSSLVRLDAGNSPLVGQTTDLDLAPDGSLWFASGGLAQHQSATGAWTSWPGAAGEYLTVQPKAAGGYWVWSADRYFGFVFRFDTATGQWTSWLPDAPGEVAGMPGKDCVDDAGNFWAFRLAAPGEFETLEYLRPDGTWVAPPPPYPSVSFFTWAFKAYGDGRALLADEQGVVWSFDGSAWSSLGAWKPGPFTDDVDIDAAGNVWACGVGGVARRDAASGAWQRYRITNTGNYDNFNTDLTLDPATGRVWTGANAGTGVGGMVGFDNCHALTFRPSNGDVVVSPYWFYGVHAWTGAGFEVIQPTGGYQRMCEDSLGRLWALGEYFSLQYLGPAGWVPVPILGWGVDVKADPVQPGAVWAHTGFQFLRSDGVTTIARDIGSFPQLTALSDQFTGVAPDPDGTAWVGCTVQLGVGGTGGGLIHFDPATGGSTLLTYQQGWPFPGNRVTPRAVTPDGRVWMQYDDTLFPYTERGLLWWDGTSVGTFPAPPDGGPQWGGLPHAQIADVEVRPLPDGYELWMSCVSRGLAVLKVTTGGAATWTDLGSGLAGSQGVPELAGSGSLQPGSAGSLTLTGAKRSAPALLFVSLASSPVPFKGGTLVAFPDALSLALATDAAGAIALPFVWPAGAPPGTSLWFQAAVKDGGAIKGVALSNALMAVTP